MKFRDDIDPSNTWVVSDTHFGHDNIVGFCFRPDDHEQVMVAQWRATVPDDATVIHLGDLNYSNNARFKNLIAKELTGARKLLILGNHDQQRFSFYKQSGFQIIQPFALGLDLLRPEETIEGETWKLLPSDAGARSDFVVSFSHYPWGPEDYPEDGPDVLRQMPENHLRIHGHIHNNGYTRDAFVPFLRQHVNLSTEQTRYTPVNLKLLLDAVLLGQYPETTEEQLAEARARKEERLK